MHARGGLRDRYEPVRSAIMGQSAPGDAAALAAGYRTHTDATEIYVADLNAIAGGPAHDVGAIAAAGLPLLINAGAATIAAVRTVLERSAVYPPAHALARHRAVVGLETLRSFTDLSAIVAAVGAPRIVFSLDLRAGQPMGPATRGPDPRSPLDLARQAAQCGVAAIAMINVSRVGSAMGVDLGLVADLRAALPTVELLVGGGVRSAADLRELEALGCDGALVATALLGNV